MASRALLALCLAVSAHGFLVVGPARPSSALLRSAPRVAAGFGAPAGSSVKKTKGAKKKKPAADADGIGKGQTALERQWSSFSGLVGDTPDCAHDVFVRPEGEDDAPWRKVGRVAARGEIGADAAISAQFALITWSAKEIHRIALAASKKRLEIAHTPADPAALGALEAMDVELKATPAAELDAPRGALAPAVRVADAGATIAPGDVGFKPIKSPLAKEGELTHAVASNSKNIAGMMKSKATAGYGGKMGSKGGGYL